MDLIKDEDEPGIDGDGKLFFPIIGALDGMLDTMFPIISFSERESKGPVHKESFPNGLPSSKILKIEY